MEEVHTGIIQWPKEKDKKKTQRLNNTKPLKKTW
jgi:hypothetical protein